ncbi:11475_t:CDS:1, partial [Acaulospora colombiana]
ITIMSFIIPSWYAKVVHLESDWAFEIGYFQPGESRGLLYCNMRPSPI